MMREAGHRRLMALGQREPQDLRGDLGVFAEDLVEIT